MLWSCHEELEKSWASIIKTVARKLVASSGSVIVLHEEDKPVEWTKEIQALTDVPSAVDFQVSVPDVLPHRLKKTSR